MRQEAEQIMKRCQAGTRNYDEANNLHAACYGLIGKLLAQRKPLTDKAITKVIDSMPRGINGWMSDWDLYEFARAIEAKLKENT